MDVREFDFDLLPHLIAQEPPAERTAARLLCVDRQSGVATDSLVSALPELLRAGDLLVFNNTRVFPARLLGRRVPSGGAVECLLVRRLLPDARVGEASGAELWEALVHPGQKLKPGARAVFQGVMTLRAEILERGFFGRRVIRLCADDGRSVEEAIDVLGHVPLPPYIKRQDASTDRDRYQTVFASRRGSIAAPTAGLHFTPALLDALSARGVARAEITLHVGYGTFQPVRVERIEDHRLEAEHYEIGPEAAEAINRAGRERRRVIAVGTTTTRALESVAREHDGALVPCSGSSDLFISPGFPFRVLGGLLTNFHLPRSSLLMLVSAFAGRDRILVAYRTAVARGYRFYSYGDAMLIT
jgi:S-adenosylmethionine:tRNA ribosyltransferase-isomerase